MANENQHRRDLLDQQRQSGISSSAGLTGGTGSSSRNPQLQPTKENQDRVRARQLRAAGRSMQVAGRAAQAGGKGAEVAGRAVGAGAGAAVGGLGGALGGAIAGSVIPGAGTLAGAAAGFRNGAQAGAKVGGTAGAAPGKAISQAGKSTAAVGRQLKKGTRLNKLMQLGRLANLNSGQGAADKYRAIKRVLNGVKLTTGTLGSVGEIFFSAWVFLIVANGEWLYSAFINPQYKLSMLNKMLVVFGDLMILLILLFVATTLGTIGYIFVNPIDTVTAVLGAAWSGLKNLIGGFFGSS